MKSTPKKPELVYPLHNLASTDVDGAERVCLPLLFFFPSRVNNEPDLSKLRSRWFLGAEPPCRTTDPRVFRPTSVIAVREVGGVLSAHAPGCSGCFTLK